MSKTEPSTLRDLGRAKGYPDPEPGTCPECGSTDAELARLRAVVEAVQALADEWQEAYPGPSAAWHGTPNAWWQELRAALAPVSSSGEAESGAGHEHDWMAPMYTDQPERECSVCGATDATPAPVPSGGQGEALVEAVAAKVHEAWMATKREQGVSSRPSEWGEEQMVPYAALSERAKDLDRATVTAVLDALRAAGFAARPVLSREALVGVLTEHRYLCHSARGEMPRWEECSCGKRFVGTDPWRMLAAHQADHLTDVLATEAGAR